MLERGEARAGLKVLAKAQRTQSPFVTVVPPFVPLAAGLLAMAVWALWEYDQVEVLDD